PVSSKRCGTRSAQRERVSRLVGTVEGSPDGGLTEKLDSKSQIPNLKPSSPRLLRREKKLSTGAKLPIPLWPATLCNSRIAFEPVRLVDRGLVGSGDPC